MCYIVLVTSESVFVQYYIVLNVSHYNGDLRIHIPTIYYILLHALHYNGEFQIHVYKLYYILLNVFILMVHDFQTHICTILYKYAMPVGVT